MKVTLPRDRLEPAIATARRVVAGRTTIPVLLTVLIRAAGEHLEIIATDLDRMVRVTIPAEVAERGEVCVDAKVLAEAVKKTPDGGTIEIEAAEDSGRLTFSCGRYRVRLHTLPTSDFPELNLGEIKTAFEIPGPVLANALDIASTALSNDEARYYLNGVYIAEDKLANMVFVGTDGHRLIRASIDMPDDAGGLSPVIVPTNALAEICQVAKAAAPNVEIEIGETMLRARGLDVTFTTKLIDGTYPDYERIIPVDFSASLMVSAGDFRKAIERVCVVAEQKSRAVKLTIGAETLAISAAGESGEASDELEIPFDGEPREIGFNGRYLVDMLALAPSTVDVIVSMNDDPGSPVQITSETLDGVTMILMPMRVG